MGVFDWIFRRPRSDTGATRYFKTLNGYTPVFTSAPESIYEMELTRAAIHSFATACAKLKPEVVGGHGTARIAQILASKPNHVQDTYKFLYRVATILAVHNTCFITPIENDFGDIVGLYPLVPRRCEVIDHCGVPYLRYTFGNGAKAAMELSRVGIMVGHQSQDDIFGDPHALRATLELMHTQNEGIIQSVKSSAAIRFLVQVAGQLKPKEIPDQRKAFVADNLSADSGGVILYDSTISQVTPIESRPFVVDADQVNHIKQNAYSYFGVNEKILQNSYSEDEWNAFYEGKVEPFAIQLSLVLSNMVFTEAERARGCKVYLSANRLQYASNSTKLAISTQMFDRGLLNRNQIMEIWNMPLVEGGDQYFIRREYMRLDAADNKETINAVQSDSSGVPGASA